MKIKIKKKNVLNLYSLPQKVRFCKICTISNQRPRITFDQNGVCSACNFASFKKTVNWKQREEELSKLCDKFRKSNGDYDIIIPCSGGKDGSMVAHQMKYVYDMNPLCVTWSPLSYTEIGRKNLDNFIASGFNHILGNPNPMATKKLTELSFKKIGDPFQPFIYGQYNFPLSIALNFNVSLIMYGENGEVEYGGDMKNAYKPDRSVEDQLRHYFSGVAPKDFTEMGINKIDLKPFDAPDLDKLKKNKTEIHFFSYYKFWDPQENVYYAQENCSFEPNPERNEGTFSKYASLDDKFDGFHYYLAYIKFGIGRCTQDSAHEVRDGKITREEGVSLVKKYDGEFPKKYFKEFLEFCSISEEEFNKVIDSWRSDHIWTKDKEGRWALKSPIWS